MPSSSLPGLSVCLHSPFPPDFPQSDTGCVLQVANVNVKDGTCTLKDCVYKDVQKDWPGYSEGDQQLLKRMLVR